MTAEKRREAKAGVRYAEGKVRTDYDCPECGAVYTTEGNADGKEAQCNQCGTDYTVRTQ